MTRALASITIVALLLFLAGPAIAQQSSSPRPPAGGAQQGAPAQPALPMGPGMGGMHPGGGMPGGMMGGMQGMGGMCMPMMGMQGMMDHHLDPKTRGLLMQMHGETMKAVGDVMIKYGKMFESQPR
jgi:hypothetical protein